MKMAGPEELIEAIPLTALRAPANIKAARVAIIVFFIFHVLLRTGFLTVLEGLPF